MFNLELNQPKGRARTALLTFGLPALLVVGILVLLVVLRDGAEGLLGRVAELLPVGYAFAAGMVASVNPCGVLMLPSYALYQLGTEGEDEKRPAVRRALRALRIAMVVTGGFVLVFAIVGAAVAAGGQWLAGIFPYAGLLIGVAMAGLGVWLLIGHRTLGIAAAGRVRLTPQRTLANMALFGVVYAVGSLGCTLPIFLVVVGSALAVGDWVGSFSQFLGYALGMGSVILVVTLGTALFRRALSRWLDRLTSYVHRFSAMFLIAAGIYLAFYWISVAGLF